MIIFPHPAISVTKKRYVMLDSSLPVYFCYRLMHIHFSYQALYISNFRFIFFFTHHFFQILLRTGAKEKDTRSTASGTITWNATTATSNTDTKGFNHLTPNCCEEISNTKLQNLHLCLSVYRCICVDKKNQLDATECLLHL